MKLIKFASTPAYLITSEETKNKLKKIVKETLDISLNFKNYSLLNEGNIDFLKKDIENYLFGPVSFGQKYFLFLTKLDDKEFSIFINKKKLDMIALNLDFDNSLFTNTLLDGELFKNNGKWCFQMTDIYMLNNKNILDDSLSTRMEYLNDIIKNKFKSNSADPCLFNVIKYIKLNFIRGFYSIRDELEYKVSGVSFKHKTENKNFNFIFMENRKSSKSSNKFDVILKLKKTSFPDVYDLYCKKNDRSKQLVNYGFATVPTFELSKKLRLLFEDNDDLLFGCNYIKSFKNFVPKIHIMNETISTLKKVEQYKEK